MDINLKLEEIKELVLNLNIDDKEDFVRELYKWLFQLTYFYNTLVPKYNSISETQYYIKSELRPKAGQVAYFSLRRGYPKETYDDHWCYIVAVIGNKYLVVPTTSVKPDSNGINPMYELDIKIKDFENNCISRMQISDIRSIDAMRLVTSKKPCKYDVETDRKIILDKIREVIFLDK